MLQNVPENTHTDNETKLSGSIEQIHGCSDCVLATSILKMLLVNL